MTRNGKLKPMDHAILLGLIRGKTVDEVALDLHISKSCVGTRLARSRKLIECQTTYQLIALEMVNLLEEGV